MQSKEEASTKTNWTHRCPTNNKGHPKPHQREQAPERKGRIPYAKA